LSRLVDGTVVVVHAGQVRRGQLAQALANLDQVSARVLGVVLNRLGRDEEYYAYGRARSQEPAVAEAPSSPRTGKRDKTVSVG
jgi:succinoglycan biosynthesis transport protein ExoP